MPTAAQSNAARKAWETRRARAAAVTATAAILSLPVPTVKAAIAEKPAIVNVTRDGSFDRPVYVRPVLEPVAELLLVDLYVDDATVGCGQRSFIVLAKSTIEVKLLYWTSLLTITVSRQHFDDNHLPRRRVNRAFVAKAMRDRIALADRVNADAQRDVLADGGADAVQALELLAQT